MKKAIADCLLLSFAVVFAFAAEFWTKKPYTQWSRKDVKQMLSNSPWATSQTLRHTVLKQVRREFGRPSRVPGTGEGENDPALTYTVYLRSAQPVREAIVRTAQLQANYDNLDAAGKQAFDAKWSQYLATTQDKVIFQVTYSSNIAEVDRQLAAYWQTQTLETLQDTTYMTGPDGQRASPVAFWVARGGAREFQLAFPRPPGSFSPDVSLSLEFIHPDLSKQPAARTDARVAPQPGLPPDLLSEPATRMFFKFSLKEMQYHGSATY